MSNPASASFTSVDEAMDMVRAGLSFLARCDTAELPAVTQARLLREWSGPSLSTPRRGRGSWRCSMASGVFVMMVRRPASVADVADEGDR